jgi:hypothetical protein
MLRKTLKSVAGLVLGLGLVTSAVSLVVVVAAPLAHPSDMTEEFLVILGSAVGAIITAGVLRLLVDIADSLTLVNDRKLGL